MGHGPKSLDPRNWGQIPRTEHTLVGPFVPNFDPCRNERGTFQRPSALLGGLLDEMWKCVPSSKRTNCNKNSNRVFKQTWYHGSRPSLGTLGMKTGMKTGVKHCETSKLNGKMTINYHLSSSFFHTCPLQMIQMTIDHHISSYNLALLGIPVPLFMWYPLYHNQPSQWPTTWFTWGICPLDHPSSPALAVPVLVCGGIDAPHSATRMELAVEVHRQLRGRPFFWDVFFRKERWPSQQMGKK